ncbi:EAL domain-containing protein [Neobacillus sp. K501]
MSINPKNELFEKFMVSHSHGDKEATTSETLLDFYSLLYKHYPDAIFTLDKEGKFLAINDKAEKYVGYRRSELIGRNFSSVLKKEQINMVQMHFVRALKGEPQNYNCEAIHKDGQTVHLSITNIPIRINGEIVGVFGFGKNQTALVQRELELTKITNSLNLAQEIAMIGSWDYDIDTNLVLCSNSLLDILGVSSKRDKVFSYGNLLKMIYFPEERDNFDFHFQGLKRNGGKIVLEYKVQRPDGHIITFRTTAEAKKDKDGNVTRIIGVVKDISEQVLTENRLKESEEKFRNISNNLDVGIWSMDFSLNQIVYVSSALEKITGYNLEVFLHGEKTWADIIHPDDKENYLERQSKLPNGQILNQQYRIIMANDEAKWIEDKTFPILNTKGQLIRLDGIIQDISERKQNEEKINFIANHDYLTELPNRRMFDRQLKELILEYKTKEDKFALFYLDIDRFKFVNDTLGHEIGDILLQEISRRLKSIAGKNLLFRLGGDEFAIVLTNIHKKDYFAFGKEIIRTIKKPYQIEGYDINISTSIGVNIFPDDGETLTKLKMNADAALYRAKDLGENNIQFFTKTLNSESYELFNLENELRNAIRNDEFLLYYQPRVDTFSGEMVGAEALIRWNHPKRGPVSPAQFIPVAEETELINEISYWVIKTVCTQLKEWKVNGYSLMPISINLSAKTLMKADLVENIKMYLLKYSISPSLFEIEITEDSLIKNEGLGLSTIEQLREMGVSIALDDFGTGFSSIGYLKRFKVDYLKIDRSFIKDIHKAKDDLTIVKSIILLAKGFGLKVVAEGVEEEEQWELLRKLNCHYIQGFLFHKPLPEIDFTKLLTLKK